MEQETKFTIKDSSTADCIWEEVLAGKYGEPFGAECIDMEGAYFDTKSLVLNKNNIAIRVRCEGKICFATMKWGGNKVIEGLHEHQEINIPVDTDSCFVAPPVELFEDSIDGKKMSDILEGETLDILFKTQIQRRRAKLPYGSSIVELAIDQGKVMTEDAEEAISEIEIELYSGELSDIIQLTQIIADKYQLEAENRSKYERAVALIRK